MPDLRLGEDEADADEDGNEAQQEGPLEALLAEPEDLLAEREPLLHGEVAGLDQEVAEAQREGHLQEAGEVVAVDVGPGDRADVVPLGAAEDGLVAAEHFGHAVEGLEEGRGQDDDDEDLDPAAGSGPSAGRGSRRCRSRGRGRARRVSRSGRATGSARRRERRSRPGRGRSRGRSVCGGDQPDEPDGQRDELKEGEGQENTEGDLEEDGQAGGSGIDCRSHGFRSIRPSPSESRYRNRRSSCAGRTSVRRDRGGTGRASPLRRRRPPIPRPTRWAGERRGGPRTAPRRRCDRSRYALLRILQESIAPPPIEKEGVKPTAGSESREAAIRSAMERLGAALPGNIRKGWGSLGKRQV